jgi:hypothetical protein
MPNAAQTMKNAKLKSITYKQQTTNNIKNKKRRNISLAAPFKFHDD